MELGRRDCRMHAKQVILCLLSERNISRMMPNMAASMSFISSVMVMRPLWAISCYNWKVLVVSMLFWSSLLLRLLAVKYMQCDYPKRKKKFMQCNIEWSEILCNLMCGTKLKRIPHHCVILLPKKQCCSGSGGEPFVLSEIWWLVGDKVFIGWAALGWGISRSNLALETYALIQPEPNMGLKCHDWVSSFSQLG